MSGSKELLISGRLVIDLILTLCYCGIMSVRYLNATGAQDIINEVKRRLASLATTADVQAVINSLDAVTAAIPSKTSDLQNDSGFTTATMVAETYETLADAQQAHNVIQQNTNAIATLNADATTPGSVDYKIAQAGGGGGGGGGGVVEITATSPSTLMAALLSNSEPKVAYLDYDGIETDLSTSIQIKCVLWKDYPTSPGVTDLVWHGHLYDLTGVEVAITDPYTSSMACHITLQSPNI